jgi:hypothetical protein
VRQLFRARFVHGQPFIIPDTTPRDRRLLAAFSLPQINRDWVGGWVRYVAAVGAVVRYVAAHTGLPALIVAAGLIVIGYRLLRRSFRFALEVALVAFALFAATRIGWLRW